MKVFFAFIKKEFQHVIRDRRSLLILIGLPVMMMLLFGFALSNEVKNSRFAILDYSNDETTTSIVDKMDQSKYFTYHGRIKNEDEIETLFKRGEVKLVIIFPRQVNQDLRHTNKSSIRLVADAADANTANIIINYASNIVRDYMNTIFTPDKLPYTIEIENRMMYNPQLLSTFNFVPGVMTLILMILGAMMTSVSIVKERERGTMEVLLVSPVKPLFIVISKAIPYILLCFIDVLIILLLAYTVLEMPVRGSIGLLLAESLLFILTTISLGLLISTITDSQQSAMFISLVGLLMPSLIFSGFMFPLENMPKPLQILSNIVPTKWFYLIVKSIMVKGLSLQAVVRPTLILLGMSIFLMIMAIKKFKIRLA
jgi:ABC-2 type transport system permease protein